MIRKSLCKFQAVGPNRAGIISLSDDAVAAVSSNTSDLNKSLINNKWIPQTLLRSHQQANGNLIRTQEDKDNDVFRRCRALLNKLTPEKFDKLADDLANPSFGIDSPHLLKGVILLIFDKALAEPNYCSLYAELCRRLDRDAPNFEPADAPIRTFRRLLLAKCEYEFEHRILLGQSMPSTNPADDDMDPQEARIQARKKAIGNIKLIGELGKLDLVSEAILHKCLKTLLKRGTNDNLTERCEDLECLRKILQTVGKKLDQGQGKNLMDQYLERIKKIQTQQDLPLRIKFILQDMVDLRSNNWLPRLAFIEKETKLTDEDGNTQTQITYKYNPTNSMIPSLTNPFTYPFHTSSSTPTSLFQRPQFHPSILQRPRATQITSDRYQFERLNPLSTETESSNTPAPRQTYRSTNSPKSRLRQHDSLTNPFDNPSSSKETDTSHKIPNGHSNNRSSNSPTYTNGLTANGGSTNRSNTSSSSSFSLRPKQSFNHRTPMTDREEMESPIVSKSTNDINKKSTSEILANHPLTKNMNNLSTLINKSKDSHHHHHHPNKTSNQTTPATTTTTTTTTTTATAITRDELFSKYNTFLQMSLDDFELIHNQLRTLKLSKSQIVEFIQYLFDQSLHEHNKNILFIVRLLIYLHKNSFLTNQQCINVLTNILSKIHDYEKEFALFKSELATIIANIIWACLTNEQDDSSNKNNGNNHTKKSTSSSAILLSLNDVCDLLKDGQHHPLFLLILQQLQQLCNNDENYMCNLLERFRINMRDMLPESERQDTLLLQVLEVRHLAYLCPYLKLRVELLDKLSSASIDSNEFLSFVEHQTKSYDKNTQSFIQTLVTCIYETAISSTLTSCKTDKTILNQEKICIEMHRQCLQTYLKTVEQQVWALYSLQLIAYKNNFPKELLLRLFVYSYDLDIIEEDAYFKWKEDINDDIPGKGKALFQVSKWLQWLEHASEESDDNDNDDNNNTNSQRVILNDKENVDDLKNIEQEQNA
ncbi:unnamed protein product [Adineta steineri]|uniref:Eukaryotic translation initiation factor 4 gamma 2 n=1 Tax=Adineta steineri TaxID=433720 RepID=A0A813YX93_9BILA|nr:unnamed protein product [Adineta steineri]CAF1472908.1 unnamed protein product [Adineta steineri]